MESVRVEITGAVMTAFSDHGAGPYQTLFLGEPPPAGQDVATRIVVGRCVCRG